MTVSVMVFFNTSIWQIVIDEVRKLNRKYAEGILGRFIINHLLTEVVILG